MGLMKKNKTDCMSFSRPDWTGCTVNSISLYLLFKATKVILKKTKTRYATYGNRKLLLFKIKQIKNWFGFIRFLNIYIYIIFLTV